MKRILVLIAVLALMLSLFAGCGRYGEADDGTNVSTTDNGIVNGTNPNGTARTGGNTGGTSGSNNGTAGANSGSGTGMGAGAGSGSGMDDAV